MFAGDGNLPPPNSPVSISSMAWPIFQSVTVEAMTVGWSSPTDVDGLGDVEVGVGAGGLESLAGRRCRPRRRRPT